MPDNRDSYIPHVDPAQLEHSIEKKKIDPGSSALLEAEEHYICEWRNIRSKAKESNADDLIGLSLSGGGIRSATFSLGIMQAMAKHGVLNKIDYLSTVSGGGYIGSALTWLTSKMALSHQEKKDKKLKPKDFNFSDNFPFGVDDSRPDAKDRQDTSKQKRMLQYLREHGYYLTPGAGINAFSLLGAVLRGMLLNLLVWIPVFVLVFMFLISIPQLLPIEEIFLPVISQTINHLNTEFGFESSTANASSHVKLLFFELSLYLSLLIAAILAVFALCYSLATFWSDGISRYWYTLRRDVEKTVSKAMVFAVMLFVIGTLPLVDFVLMGYWNSVGPVATVTGIIIALRIFFSSGDDRKGMPPGIMAPLSALLFLYGIALSCFQLAFQIEMTAWSYAIAAGLLAWALIFGLVVNLNYISIHRYYRDRLMETFMPDISSALDDHTGKADGANGARLHEVSTSDEPSGPYHIVNTNVVLANSEKRTYKYRGGDNFILSPLYCGSNATGWRRTEEFMDGGMTLATAVAISGAAANPNTGVGGTGLTRNLFISLVMSLLNLRLGYWARNPKQGICRRPNHFIPGGYSIGNALSLKEKGFNEERPFVQLSDGGHFENMGLYELIRRKVKVAMVCDGGADPEFSFSDLQTTLRRIEVDFGARIHMLKGASSDEIVPMPPEEDEMPAYPKQAEFSRQGFMIGQITYADDSNGWLIFMKSTLIREADFMVKGYKAEHDAFPDQSTVDQFFDDVQFESYRKLGYSIADQMLKASMPNELRELVVGVPTVR